MLIIGLFSNGAFAKKLNFDYSDFVLNFDDYFGSHLFGNALYSHVSTLDLFGYGGAFLVVLSPNIRLGAAQIIGNAALVNSLDHLPRPI